MTRRMTELEALLDSSAGDLTALIEEEDAQINVEERPRRQTAAERRARRAPREAPAEPEAPAETPAEVPAEQEAVAEPAEAPAEAPEKPAEPVAAETPAEAVKAPSEPAEVPAADAVGVVFDLTEEEARRAESRLPKRSERRPADADDVRRTVGDMLCVPKTKGSLPTLVRYSPKGKVPKRAVIIDIGGPLLEEAWAWYKRSVSGADPEEFLLLVYEVTRTEMPRMYRTVSEMVLE